MKGDIKEKYKYKELRCSFIKIKNEVPLLKNLLWAGARPKGDRVERDSNP